MPSIHLHDAEIALGDHFTVRCPDWTLEPGQHWVLIGPNGAGKSALAAALAGEGDWLGGSCTGRPAAVAVVSFEAQAALIEAERRKDDADILDVISEGTPAGEVMREGCQDDALQAELVTALGVAPLLTQSFRKLSTGETRKLLLIRALASRPALLVLDEPFEGLDVAACATLHRVLAGVADTTQMVFVLNRFDDVPDFVSHLGYVGDAVLQHRVSLADTDAAADVRRLLHISQQDISLPAAPVADRPPALDPAAPLVALRGGRVAYGEKVVFDGVDWAVEPGQHWQLSGPNGSGKTCLLNLITGDHPQCYVNDIVVFGMQRGSGESIWDIKQHIGYVSSALQWEYKVSVSLRNAVVSGFYDSIGLYRRASDEHKAIAAAWLAVMGLSDRADQPFSGLSFGDQRLALIARAMVKHPNLLILDEPCIGLDDINRSRVLALVEHICRGTETTVLYVNHREADHVSGIANHLRMGDGQAIEV
ncbi:MAG: molybdate ABC transporter ATP-binding protein ModF [Pseudomonadota bacterium]